MMIDNFTCFYQVPQIFWASIGYCLFEGKIFFFSFFSKNFPDKITCFIETNSILDGTW